MSAAVAGGVAAALYPLPTGGEPPTPSGFKVSARIKGVSIAAAKGASSPFSPLWALAVILVWAATGPWFHYSDTWQLVVNTGTTIVSFIMNFMIMVGQRLDTKAIQAKLDVLIEANERITNKWIQIEERTEDELDALRPSPSPA